MRIRIGSRVVERWESGLGCAPPEWVGTGEVWRRGARAGGVPGGAGMGVLRDRSSHSAAMSPGCLRGPVGEAAVLGSGLAAPSPGTGRGGGAADRGGPAPAGSSLPGRSRSAAGAGRTRRASKPKLAFGKGCLLTGADCNRPWRFPLLKAGCGLPARPGAPALWSSAGAKLGAARGWAGSCLKASGL